MKFLTEVKLKIGHVPRLWDSSPPLGLPTYTLHFRAPRLRETGQSTLEIAYSPTGRSGPFESPSRKP